MKLRNLTPGVLFALAAISNAQTSFNGSYSQNFDGLPNETGEIFFPNDTEIPGLQGWYSKPGPGETLLHIDDGTLGNSGIYSVGTEGSSERALGSKSGNAGTLFGLGLTNNTNQTLTSLEISFYGELWRDAQANGLTANSNTLFVGYRIGGTNLTDGDYTSLTNFNLVSGPGVAEDNQPLDGNAHRTFKSGTLNDLSLAPGQTFWLSFRGQAYPRDEALFGIDDLTIVAPQAVPEPASLFALSLGGLAFLRRRRTR